MGFGVWKLDKWVLGNPILVEHDLLTSDLFPGQLDALGFDVEMPGLRLLLRAEYQSTAELLMFLDTNGSWGCNRGVDIEALVYSFVGDMQLTKYLLTLRFTRYHLYINPFSIFQLL